MLSAAACSNGSVNLLGGSELRSELGARERQLLEILWWRGRPSLEGLSLFGTPLDAALVTVRNGARGSEGVFCAKPRRSWSSRTSKRRRYSRSDLLVMQPDVFRLCQSSPDGRLG